MHSTTSTRVFLKSLLVLSFASVALGGSAAELLGTGRDINIRTFNRTTYLTAPNGGGSDLFANKYEPKAWETFTLIDLNGGKLNSWDRVCLKTHGGHYVVAENGGGREARANRTECGPWETFRIVKLSGPAGWPVNGELQQVNRSQGIPVAFLTSNGHWLVAENGGGGAVNANRSGIGDWERFTVFIRSSN